VTSSLRDVQLGFVDTFTDAEEFVRWLGERRPVLAWDSETAGLDPWAPDARVRLVQFGDAMTGWAIPWERWGGLAYEVLDRYEGQMTAHNRAFDEKYFRVCAPDWQGPWATLDDTMLMARIDNPTGSAALKNLGTKLVDKSAARGQQVLDEAMSKNGWTFNTVPLDFEPFVMYGAMDVVLTARIWEILKPRVPKAVYDLELETRRICTRMEINGARVDVAYSEEKYVQLIEYAQAVAAWGREKFDIDLGSTKQLSDWLLANGYEPTKLTPSGRPSMDKGVLDGLAAEGWPIAQHIVKMRQAEKLASTYFYNFVERQHDGLLHPSINTLAARTSRMSVSQPALQTLPRGQALVRNAFIPRNEGEVILTSDYSQIEMRLIAHFSHDTALIRAFEEADNTGGDFFTVIGKQIYGPTFEKSDPRRGLVKNTMYASGYGAGIPKMALTAGVPLAVMESVANAVFDQFPGIKGLQAKLVDEAIRTGHMSPDGRKSVQLPTGRKLYVDDDREYTATNYLVQGHAAEVLKRALVQLDNAGLTDMMIVPVHDEVVFSVPAGDVEEVKIAIRDAMTVTTEMGYLLQIPADPEGPFPRWGTKYEKESS
jgi:DNA polymerase-1